MRSALLLDLSIGVPTHHHHHHHGLNPAFIKKMRGLAFLAKLESIILLNVDFSNFKLLLFTKKKVRPRVRTKSASNYLNRTWENLQFPPRTFAAAVTLLRWEKRKPPDTTGCTNLCPSHDRPAIAPRNTISIFYFYRFFIEKYHLIFIVLWHPFEKKKESACNPTNLCPPLIWATFADFHRYQGNLTVFSVENLRQK